MKCCGIADEYLLLLLIHLLLSSAKVVVVVVTNTPPFCAVALLSTKRFLDTARLWCVENTYGTI